MPVCATSGRTTSRKPSARRRSSLPTSGGTCWAPCRPTRFAARRSSSYYLHAVDRIETAIKIERQLETAERSLAAFVEVNVGGESSKHGFAPEQLLESAGDLAALVRLRIAGLMTIPPPSVDAASTRSYFRTLRELRDRLRDREGDAIGGALSMGMSEDFELAIEEGATHVRIGTALFGSRG